MSVVVLIINNYTKESDPNVDNIKMLFSDPFFIVEVCRLIADVSENISVGDADDTKIYCKALKYAQKKYPQLPCLLIKDNNVCYLNATEMKNKIQDACVILNDDASTATHVKDAKATANLIYLNVYADQCSKYTAVSILNGNSSKYTAVSGTVPNEVHPYLVWTKKPNSTQALLFSPAARDLLLTTSVDDAASAKGKTMDPKGTIGPLLNDLIKNEKLQAMAFSPNLVEFDIKFALDNKDYNKLAQCANMESSTMDSTSFITLVWVIIIIIFLMILIFLTMQNIHYHPADPTV